MNAILTILIGSIFVNNFAMSRFYGICPFLGVSKKLETAFGMGMAVTFVMAVASLVAYLVNAFLLIPLGLEYLQTIAFILVIAVLVQIVEMAIKKMSPGLYQALGVYLPLITTNCAVLGVAQLNVTEGYNLILSVVTTRPMVECSLMTFCVPNSAARSKGISSSDHGVRTIRRVSPSVVPSAPSTI